MFEDAVENLRGAELRKMFGYPAAFVNGNMIGGLFQDRMMLRLSPSDLSRMRDEEGAKPFEPMPGRVMREYVVVPEKILKSKPALGAWLARSLTYTSSLPAKPSKSKGRK